MIFGQMKSIEKILVIRHGALGDFCMATGAMKAIRERHPQAHITLMTQAFLADLGKRLGWFDEVMVDNRPRSPRSIFTTLKRMAWGGYDLVYDLQGTHRTRRTYRFGSRLLGYFGRWVSVGDAHFDLGFSEPDISQLHGENEHFGLLPERFALMIPGCGPRNPEKRWPANNYRALAEWLGAKGIRSVVLGTKVEAPEIDAICQDNHHALSFMGLSQLSDIPDLARRSCLVVGNDTGPTHMARLTGAKTVLLLPGYSAHLAEGGARQCALMANRVEDITLDKVMVSAERLLLGLPSAPLQGDISRVSVEGRQAISLVSEKLGCAFRVVAIPRQGWNNEVFVIESNIGAKAFVRVGNSENERRTEAVMSACADLKFIPSLLCEGMDVGSKRAVVCEYLPASQKGLPSCRQIRSMLTGYLEFLSRIQVLRPMVASSLQIRDEIVDHIRELKSWSENCSPAEREPFADIFALRPEEYLYPLEKLQVVHNDFHPWNVGFGSRGLIAIYDFDEIACGHPCEDLTSFCFDRCSGFRGRRWAMRSYREIVRQAPWRTEDWRIALNRRRIRYAYLAVFNENATFSARRRFAKKDRYIQRLISRLFA